MGLTIENSEKLIKETHCQESIHKEIDLMNDFVFEAGAGSGKNIFIERKPEVHFKIKVRFTNRKQSKSALHNIHECCCQ